MTAMMMVEEYGMREHSAGAEGGRQAGGRARRRKEHGCNDNSRGRERQRQIQSMHMHKSGELQSK